MLKSESPLALGAPLLCRILCRKMNSRGRADAGIDQERPQSTHRNTSEEYPTRLFSAFVPFVFYAVFYAAILAPASVKGYFNNTNSSAIVG